MGGRQDFDYRLVLLALLFAAIVTLALLECIFAFRPSKVDRGGLGYPWALAKLDACCLVFERPIAGTTEKTPRRPSLDLEEAAQPSSHTAAAIEACCARCDPVTDRLERALRCLSKSEKKSTRTQKFWWELPNWFVFRCLLGLVECFLGVDEIHPLDGIPNESSSQQATSGDPPSRGPSSDDPPEPDVEGARQKSEKSMAEEDAESANLLSSGGDASDGASVGGGSVGPQLLSPGGTLRTILSGVSFEGQSDGEKSDLDSSSGGRSLTPPEIRARVLARKKKAAAQASNADSNADSNAEAEGGVAEEKAEAEEAREGVAREAAEVPAEEAGEGAVEESRAGALLDLDPLQVRRPLYGARYPGELPWDYVKSGWAFEEPELFFQLFLRVSFPLSPIGSLFS